jgi:hypothetical protein
MAKSPRVYNQSRGFWMKLSQAVRGVESCALAWVEFGSSVRSLTFAEAIEARKLQAARREPLPLAELHGLKYQPAIGHEAEARIERQRAKEANQFAQLVTA